MYDVLVSAYYYIKNGITKMRMAISLKDSQLAVFRKTVSFMMTSRKLNAHTVVNISINKYNNGYIAQCILSTPYGRLIVGVDNTDHLKYILESYTDSTKIVDYVGKCGLSYEEFISNYGTVVVVTHALELQVFDKEKRPSKQPQS